MISCSRIIKMNEVINKFLLARDIFTPEINLKHLDLLIVLVNHLLKIRQEFKNLKKQEIQNIFSEIN